MSRLESLGRTGGRSGEWGKPDSKHRRQRVSAFPADLGCEPDLRRPSESARSQLSSFASTSSLLVETSLWSATCACPVRGCLSDRLVSWTWRHGKPIIDVHLFEISISPLQTSRCLFSAFCYWAHG